MFCNLLVAKTGPTFSSSLFRRNRHPAEEPDGELMDHVTWTDRKHCGVTAGEDEGGMCLTAAFLG